MSTVRVVRSGLFAAALTLAALPGGAAAQQRPLVTQDPEVIGGGRLLLEGGVETGSNIEYPVSGLVGDRVSMPIGVSVGLGTAAEFQVDAGYQWLGIDSRGPAPLAFRVRAGERTSDVIDAVVATKIRLVPETGRRPAIGVRFATQLPNASNESGLGLDTVNFFGTLLVGKTVGSVRVVANAGFGVLSDVLEGSTQQDAFTGSLSVQRALSSSIDVVGEVAGRKVLFADTEPIGAEPHGAVRAAARYTRGAWRVDGGLVLGLTARDPDIGVIAGLTWVGQVR